MAIKDDRYPFTLLEREIDSARSSNVRCGCDLPADHLLTAIRDVADPDSPIRELGFRLEGHVQYDCYVYEVAVHMIGVLYQALLCDIPSGLRRDILTNLWRIAAGEGPYADECYRLMIRGMSVLHRELEYGCTEHARDVLELLDNDRDRQQYYQMMYAEG